MKKIILLLCLALPFANASLLKAQCYGVVTLDKFVDDPSPATSSSVHSFTINSTFPNELILIGYDGWEGPGTGPITVDGNPATHIATADAPLPGNTGAAETYAYSAPLAGVHTVACTETGYTSFGSSAYDINFAADFYCAGGLTPLTVASLTSTTNTVINVNGGPISCSINTTKPNSMVYCNAQCNEVSSNSYSFTWANATFMDDIHFGNGIECSDAYESECATGAHSITATNPCPNSSNDGGLAIVLVDIPPTLAASCFTASVVAVNPTCGNNNGSITLTGSGGAPPYTYTWTPNVSTTFFATGLSAGTYTIVMGDASCEDTTLIVTLTGPNINLTANVTANENCFGDCAGSATAVFTGGLAPFTYNWTPSGGTTATANGLCQGTYTITAKDANGCTHTQSVTITQPTLLTATATSTNELCNGGNIGTATAIPAGGTAPYTYSWNPSGQATVTAIGLIAGSYTVTVTDNHGCTATAITVITQPTALTVSATGPPTLCPSIPGTLTATVNGGTPPYTYLWVNTGAATSTASVTISANETFTVNITDANNCGASATLTVDLATPPTINITASKPSVCVGESVTLQASATNVTGSFTWEPGGQIAPNIVVSPSVPTTYTVSAPSQCGISSASIYINVNQLPVPAFSADVTTGCAPLCIQFQDKSTSASGTITSWLWNFGNGDSTSTESPVYCYPNSGGYSVDLTITTDSGCSSSLAKFKYVDVYSNPVASFTMSPQPTTIIQPTIQFTDNSTDAYGLAYWAWNFGEAGDTVSNLQNPTHTYGDTGTYCASEVVMNIHGCTDTATNCLVIGPQYNLYIPSGFSPNGDGKNDVFKPEGNDIKSFEMYIFDRWGMELFYTSDINIGWNGVAKSTGSVCQEDGYIYLINTYDSKNKKHSFTGTVLLIK